MASTLALGEQAERLGLDVTPLFPGHRAGPSAISQEREWFTPQCMPQVPPLILQEFVLSFPLIHSGNMALSFF